MRNEKGREQTSKRLIERAIQYVHAVAVPAGQEGPPTPTETP